MIKKSTSKSAMKRWWNYRVVREEFQHQNGDREVTLAIHEAHYEGRSYRKLKPSMISTDPVAVVGEAPGELRFTLEKMLKATKKPVLEYKDFYNGMRTT